MSRNPLSKLPQSTLFLLILLASMVLSVIVKYQDLFLLVVNFLLILSIFLAVQKRRIAHIPLAGALGILISTSAFYHSMISLPVGCGEAFVTQSARNFKKNFLYEIKNKKGSAVVLAEKDETKISDKVSYCLAEKTEMNPQDKRFILGKFAKAEVYHLSKFDKIEDGKGFKRTLDDFSIRLKGVSDSLFSGDIAVLGYGLIFGRSGDFSPRIKANLKKSGTSHLVAVSGYNVSIFTSNFFGVVRKFSKNFAGATSILLLAGFYFLTGGSPSVLRAAVMGVFVLLSRFVGRRVQALHLLLLAGTLISAFNPFAIYDWGFQLSFLATAGLFFLSPSLEFLITRGRFKSDLIKIFSETLGAQIYVLPILAANFGQFSLIAPLSNLLIIPFVPLAMIFISLGLIFYNIAEIAGIFFGGMASLVLQYFLTVINLTGEIKFAFLNLTIVPIYSYVIGYLLIFLLTHYLRRICDKIKAKQDI